jgi:hypothetical protein
MQSGHEVASKEYEQVNTKAVPKACTNRKLKAKIINARSSEA